MNYTWKKTTEEVYQAIYRQHQQDFTVFGSDTKLENNSLGDFHMLTEWGFRDSPIPLIKWEQRGDREYRYAIAIPIENEEE